MTTLEISQIIFNFIASFAVVIITVLVSVIAYDTIKFTKAIKKFFTGLNKESEEIYGKLNNFLEKMLSLAFVSKFFKKKKTTTKQ